MEGWIWEDEAGGARVTGARSALWDTGFSLQALATVPTFDGVAGTLGRGADFVRRQQIGTSFEGFRRPTGPTPRAAGALPGSGMAGR